MKISVHVTQMLSDWEEAIRVYNTFGGRTPLLNMFTIACFPRCFYVGQSVLNSLTDTMFWGWMCGVYIQVTVPLVHSDILEDWHLPHSGSTPSKRARRARQGRVASGKGGAWSMSGSTSGDVCNA